MFGMFNISPIYFQPYPWYKLIVYTLPSIWHYPFFQNDIQISVNIRNRQHQEIVLVLYCIAYCIDYWPCFSVCGGNRPYLFIYIRTLFFRTPILFDCLIVWLVDCLIVWLGPGPRGQGHLGQGPWRPLGPSYRIHMESVTTYCQASYLLSGKQRQSGMHPTAP